METRARATARTTTKTKGTSKTFRYERPPVKPIPMQPLQEKTAKPTTVPSAKPPIQQFIKPKPFKMGLDIYYVTAKVEHFLLRKPDAPVHTRKPRQRVNMKLNIAGGFTIMGSHTAEMAEDNRKIELVKNKKAQYLTEMCKQTKVKVATYLARKPVSFRVNGVQINMTRPARAYKSAYLAAFTGLKPAVDPEYTPWKKLARHLNLASQFHISWVTLAGYADEWTKMRLKPGYADKYKMSDDKIAEKLGITLEDFQGFQLHEGITFESLRNTTNSRYVPDLIKQLAFSSWQRSQYDECDYYLAEAQGWFLHQEITDQQKNFICRTEERKSYRTLTSEEARKDMFRFQTSDLTDFGSTMGAFKKNIQHIDSDWNIVQLSSLFQYCNRPGPSVADPTKTQAMFLSAYTSARGKRSIYTAFVNEPKLNPAETKHGIHEQMQLLQKGNARVNELATNRTKNLYWDTRADHNGRMKALTRFLQEWIDPWAFLLPGNIKETTTITKIQKLTTHLLRTYKALFTNRVAGVMYKLIENYNVLNEKTKSQLSVLVAYILNVPIDEKLIRATKKIAELGATIKLDSPRNPTILVLDQDLMQFPWECMDCLLLTESNVTRVPSLAMIYSLNRLNKFKYKGCEEVDVDKCSFFVNPDGSLTKVETRFREYFGNRKTWTGFVQKVPALEEIEQIYEEQDLIVYCGHGSGNVIFPEYSLNRVVCRSIPMLFGCGSVRILPQGPHSAGWSPTNAYFCAAGRGVIGFLWEVTDLECDRVTADLIERMAPDTDAELPEVFRKDGIARSHETNLAACVRLCRKAARQHMTFAGIVYYGIPLSCTRKTTKKITESVTGG